MKKLFVLSLMVLLPVVAWAQEAGSLYISLTPPTNNENVGYMGAYLMLLNTETGEKRSAFLNSPTLTAYTFNDLPLGEYRFQSQAFDAIGCAGKVSDITTHQVYAPREPLEVIVASVTSAVDPKDPVGDCTDDPNCEVVSN